MRQFVPLPRAGCCWHEPGQTGALPGSLRRVKRWSRERELGGGMRDRIALDLDAAQQFIFHLNQVAWVKERRATGKERIAHLICMGMQRMRLT